MELNTITPAYAELNRQMHDLDNKYGNGSWKWAQKIVDLRDETESETVLDYGCGKGRLKEALGNPEWMSEYDPAVPGKDERPRAADIVVCTDVLEHIEPELLDNTLKHIAALSRKAVFIVIATRYSKSFLPDGENTHKIVEDAEWWKEKLSKRFFISTFEAETGELRMTGATIREIGEIIPKSAVPVDVRFAQVERNCAVVPGRVREQPRHDGRICIVAYGPSLKYTYRDILLEKRLGAKVVSVSGAHDFLIDRGIVPDYHIEVDPREHKAFFTRNAHKGVKYWVASCCHPRMIDNFLDKGCEVALWHVWNSENDWKIVAADGPDPDGSLICGGGSVGCRAVNVMYTQGYRSFSMYGMDCSFDGAGDQHAGSHSAKKQIEWQVRVGDRWYRSSGNLVYTARGFIHNFQVLHKASEANNEPFIEGTTDRVEMYLYGDGLLQEMMRQISGKAKAA